MLFHLLGPNDGPRNGREHRKCIFAGICWNKFVSFQFHLAIQCSFRMIGDTR